MYKTLQLSFTWYYNKINMSSSYHIKDIPLTIDCNLVIEAIFHHDVIISMIIVYYSALYSAL